MRKSLFSLLGLITLWSLFYAGFKYFFWGIYADAVFAPTLERISGLVLIGSMCAYTVGGLLYARFSERTMLYGATVLWVIFFSISLFLPQIAPVFFEIGMIWLGFSYSLYVIGKNTLIGREMSTSTLSSAAIGAFTTVIFIVFLIVGTVLWAKIWETSTLYIPGVLYFLALLITIVLVLIFADTRREKQSFHFSLSLYKKLFFHYGVFMIGLWCFWQISVEASQVAINYSKEYFHTSNATSSLLLIYSSIGAILGNILSVKFQSKRLWTFLIFSVIFSLVIALFSTVLDLARSTDVYMLIQILAGVVGFFFGGSVNLAESYFYSLLWSDPDKDYTSALYGFTLSAVGAVMMFISERILHTGSYLGISLFLAFLSLIALYGGKKWIMMK